MFGQIAAAVAPSLIGGIFGASGAKKQQDSSQEMAREQMDFQAQQANTARDFNERMLGSQQDYNRVEAGTQRDFNAQQAQLARDFSGSMQEDAQSFSASQVKDQRDWLERMSGSQHQRQVADLKAAGINPLLSANSGAGTPGTASPSSGIASSAAATGASASSGTATSPAMGGAMGVAQNVEGAAITSALNAYQTAAQVENLESQTRYNEANTASIAFKEAIGKEVRELYESMKSKGLDIPQAIKDLLGLTDAGNPTTAKKTSQLADAHVKAQREHANRVDNARVREIEFQERRMRDNYKRRTSEPYYNLNFER